MALQSKTLLNDVGSAVVEELAAQMNTASGYLRVPNSAALASGANDIVLGMFEEDVLVTQVSFSFTGTGNMDHADDDVALVSGVSTAGAGTSVAVEAVGYGTTDLADDTFHTITSAQAGADGAASGANTGAMPVTMSAGSALGLRITLAAAAASSATGAVVQNITVAYRPVKDALTVKPAFKQKMRSFKSVAR